MLRCGSAPRNITVFNEASPLDPPPAVPTATSCAVRIEPYPATGPIRTAREQFDATIEEFDASHSPFWSRAAIS